MSHDTEECAEVSGQETSRRRRGELCVVAACGLVAAGTFGYLDPLELVVASRWFDHVFVFGAVAVLLLGVGLTSLFPRLPTVVVAVLATGVAVLWAGLGVFASMFAPEVEAVVRAPTSQDRDYEVVVRFVHDGIIDPAWTISVRQRGGLLAHEWQACYVEENPQFEYVRWQSRRALVVSTSGGDYVIGVNPRDGFPNGRSDPGLCR